MDALRALAAGVVALGHTRDLLLNDYQPGYGLLTAAFYGVSGLGHEAVILFFVLSGYWIAKTIHRRPVEGFWSGYLIDRLSRLWVVILPALVVTMVTDAVGMALNAPVYSDLTGAHSVVPVQFDPIDYIGSVAFLQTLAVEAPGTNGPLWSVAYEFWFYIWFAALWMVLRHKRPSVALASLGLAVVYPQLQAGFACWLLGAGLFWITQYRIGKVAASAALVGGIALSGTAVILRLHDVLLAFGVAISLYGSLGLRLELPKQLDGLATYGAKGSFSLYAIHMPIVVLASTSLAWSDRLQPTTANVLAVFSLVGLAVIIAAVFAHFTEAHTTAIRDRLRAAVGSARAA